MDAIIELLQQLGVNLTIFIQLGVIILGYLVIRPISLNKICSVLQRRYEATVNTQRQAENDMTVAYELQHKYRDKYNRLQEELFKYYRQQKKEIIKKELSSYLELKKEVEDYLQQEIENYNSQLNTAQTVLKDNPGEFIDLITDKMTR
ncbi:MAG: hypothetical protein ACOCUH_02235 [Bacteriovoracia bacterium]